jgi:hypothetical protein
MVAFLHGGNVLLDYFTMPINDVGKKDSETAGSAFAVTYCTPSFCRLEVFAKPIICNWKLFN